MVAASACATEWKPTGESNRQDITTDLSYAKRSAVRPSDGRHVTAHLAFFTSLAFRLKVVDLGAGAEPLDPTLMVTKPSVGPGHMHRAWPRCSGPATQALSPD